VHGVVPEQSGETVMVVEVHVDIRSGEVPFTRVLEKEVRKWLRECRWYILIP
jgi:hypothetical protein